MLYVLLFNDIKKFKTHETRSQSVILNFRHGQILTHVQGKMVTFFFMANMAQKDTLRASCWVEICLTPMSGQISN